MKKLSHYIKSGKGRGLILVLITTFLLSLTISILTAYAGKQILEDESIASFIDSVPSFEIKGGVVQNNQIRWISAIPKTQSPILTIIDTTQDALSLPVPDGFYITRTAMYSVSDRGLRVDRASLPEEQTINPQYIRRLLQRFVFSFAVGVFIFFFTVSWLAYLLAVALTALLGWAFHVKLATHRAWRMAAVTWVFGLALSLILATMGLMYSVWFLCIATVIVNLIILKLMKN